MIEEQLELTPLGQLVGQPIDGGFVLAECSWRGVTIVFQQDWADTPSENDQVVETVARFQRTFG